MGFIYFVCLYAMNLNRYLLQRAGVSDAEGRLGLVECNSLATTVSHPVNPLALRKIPLEHIVEPSV